MADATGTHDEARTEHFRDFSESLLPKKDLSDRFCRQPFEHVEIMHGHGADQSKNFGDVYLCCAGWLSRKIGNYLDQDLANIWNSQAAREIRRSIIDGSFKYCNHQACPFIQDGTLEKREDLDDYYKGVVDRKKTYLEGLPSSFLLCYDRSCNLVCPSCRMEKILHASGTGLDLPMRINAKIMRDLFEHPTDRRFDLKVTGSGDPMASVAFRQLLRSIDARNFPGLRVELFTNGVMLTPSNWDRMSGLHGRVTLISVSIDAATADTYADVRRGPWPVLMDNLAFIGGMRQRGEIETFATNFVVQKRNYREIGDFVRLCRGHGVNRINFSFVSDWKTWPPEVFRQQAIWLTDHPEFDAFLDALLDDDLDDPIVRLGPLSEYRQRARARAAGAARRTAQRR